MAETAETPEWSEELDRLVGTLFVGPDAFGTPAVWRQTANGYPRVVIDRSEVVSAGDMKSRIAADYLWQKMTADLPHRNESPDVS